MKNSKKMLEDKTTYLINNLRLVIKRQKLDIDRLFDEVDMSKDKSLDVNELGALLVMLDKGITREEIEYLFHKFDEDGSNSIELGEFKKWLIANDVIIVKKDIEKAKRLC